MMLLIAIAITCAIGLPLLFVTFFYRVAIPLVAYVRDAETGEYNAVPYQPTKRPDRTAV
ncbi:hypothetical protein ABGB12_17115 [Actinocorallia sp. B10E7]|uniref:hypothetical protein n=1 Tax=Actinocorallia sp. B10E7 TaxID=3153558 RepID=UPI00325F61BC